MSTKIDAEDRAITSGNGEWPQEVSANIYVCSSNETLLFAADELASYIYRMTDYRPQIEVVSKDDVRPPGFLIYCDDIPGDPRRTDEFDIRARNGLVVLKGSRPRCCLYAVYAYLEAQDVRFLRPGPDGEIVPKQTRLKRVVRKHERASHDHRCICMEGATSIDHALAMVDWMAKHRMNEFQLQFETSICFWNRWYTHDLNPNFRPDGVSDELAHHGEITIGLSLEFDRILISELKKRDIDVHRMGHGWACRSLGVCAKGWEKADSEASPEIRDRIALVNGRRDWYQGIPGNTELCYSNKKAFDGLVDTVVSYAADHPEADVLLFCLADGMNQHCECNKCAELSPSDWYARLVNAISEAMSEHGLATRVSFDAYLNTIQAPEKEYIHDKSGNLIFMFAPFFRCYEHPLADQACSEGYPVGKIERNHIPMVKGNRAYIQLLREWQAHSMTDSFLCDYHFYGVHYYLLDELFVARCIYSDVVDLLKLGFNGIFSCQVLRAFYPTALGMTVMAAALWDRTLPFEEIADRHLRSAYGPFARRVWEYLEGTATLLKPSSDGHDHLLYHANDADRARKTIAYLAKWADKLKRMRARARAAVHARSLDYLIHHNTLLSLLCQAVERFASGDTDGARFKLDDATRFACDTEGDTHEVLDTWMVNFWHTERIVRWKYGPEWFLKDEKH